MLASGHSINEEDVTAYREALIQAGGQSATASSVWANWNQRRARASS
jgi:hypothetical protein